ncbi:Protein-L-isoaspartate O-methyltransferase [bacterium HR33]|nr:Protein-L-isoaspartate O-methyltransferase [bacterium HR33]
MAARRIGSPGDGYAGYRERLVEQLRAGGIENLAVLRAFAEIPRHLFVPEGLRARAYEDVALPIGWGQTISQPSTQARYLEALELRGDEKVLEVGTGSGYQTALLGFLAAQVFSIERVPELAATARSALRAAGLENVTVLVGDGTLGWRPYAPYQAILVAAAAPQVPKPLLEQLDEGGRLVMALMGNSGQELIRIRREGRSTRVERLGTANFLPLVGRYGAPLPEGENR